MYIAMFTCFNKYNNLGKCIYKEIKYFVYDQKNLCSMKLNYYRDNFIVNKYIYIHANKVVF